MPSFPIGWYVVDTERGWIVCQVFNRMADPGDGSVHKAGTPAGPSRRAPDQR